MRDLQEVRRYWPRVRRLSGDYCRVSTRSGGGARVRFHWCLFGKQFVFQFERLSANRRLWRTVRTLNCGDEFEEAMRAAGFGPRPLGKHARERVKRAEYRKQIMGYAALGPSWAAGAARLLAYYQPRLADRQRPSNGARLGRRKKEAKP